MSVRQALLHPARPSHWFSANRRLALPLHWRPWLCNRGSLTHSLTLAAAGDFQVQVLRQHWALPTATEARLLHLPPRRLALIREVQLIGQGTPWVFARSVIPRQVLRGRHHSLHRLGNHSLGSVLFSDPAIVRGPLQITRLQKAQQHWWARRSVFHLNQQPLLVTEVFLPPMAAVAYPIESETGHV